MAPDGGRESHLLIAAIVAHYGMARPDGGYLLRLPDEALLKTSHHTNVTVSRDEATMSTIITIGADAPEQKTPWEMSNNRRTDGRYGERLCGAKDPLEGSQYVCNLVRGHTCRHESWHGDVKINTYWHNGSLTPSDTFLEEVHFRPGTTDTDTTPATINTNGKALKKRRKKEMPHG